jgi:DNA-binding response OmpR family regulator/DNA-binding CsgD family transcriptional regulator
VTQSPFEPAQFLILCVEDERRLRANVVEELRDAGYRVIEADDGQAAMELLAEHTPDLVLCDITMPRLGGYELLGAVRACRPAVADVPFVFLTALSDRLAIIEGKSAGADDYLTKPIDFDLMLATIRSRLEQVARIRTTLNSLAESQRKDAVTAALLAGVDDLAATLDHVALGVVLFDARPDLIYANVQAKRALGQTISFSNGRLSSQGTQQSAQLRQALSEAVNDGQNSGAIAIEQDGGYPLLVQFITLGSATAPAGPRAAMFLIDTGTAPQFSEHLAATLFALTPTEARVAAAMLRGLRSDEITLSMGITATTFAFHLRNIFRKTGVTRQQDLIAVLSRTAALNA